MKVNPVVRIICILTVLLLNFFSVVVLINVTASMRIERDTVITNKEKQVVIKTNYETEIQRRLNDNLLAQQHSESVQKILASETIKLADIQENNQPVVIR